MSGFDKELDFDVNRITRIWWWLEDHQVKVFLGLFVLVGII